MMLPTDLALAVAVVGNENLQVDMGSADTGLGGDNPVECTDITLCSEENPCGAYVRGFSRGVGARCCADRCTDVTGYT